ncbi:hypothetical protein ACP70R_003632 [Stipagrostis hirtigluma subsp. patula]
MGRQKDRERRKAAAIAAADAARALDPAWCIRGDPAYMWLLFETPSGFAVFSVSVYYLRQPELIWTNFVKDFMVANRILFIKQYEEFEDKSAAINSTTGLDKRLRDMLKKWTRPREKLAVGSLQHQEIIEADKELGLTCAYDDVVAELIWGMKNLMRTVVPQEKKVLTKEERLPMSKALESFLHRYNFDVKPEMVNDDIVETACFLYDCDHVVEKHSKSLHDADGHLMAVSGLNSSEWSAMKLATALKMICYPQERIRPPPEMFSKDELTKIRGDAEQYVNKLHRFGVSKIYKDLDYAIKCKELKLSQMSSLVQEAKKAMESTDEAQSS